MRVEAQVGRINARWSHLFTDQDDQEELHKLARKIGMQRSWFQKGEYLERAPWLCHYDVTDSKRRAAITAGAVPISWYEAGKITAARSAARKAENEARWAELQGEQA